MTDAEALAFVTITGMQRTPAHAQLLEALRRDWAVRVLDAWADAVRDEQRGAFTFQRNGEWFCAAKSSSYGHCGQYRGMSSHAARQAAAKAVWPELPESVRAEIGECP